MLRISPKLPNSTPLCRRGATVVECAIITPAVMLLVLGIIVCGFGIFRYHQIEHLAEDSARWLSLRGPRYQRRTGSPRPTESDVLDEVILPRARSLNSDRLVCRVNWDEDESTVSVLLEYEWVPEFAVRPLVFRSNCSSPVLQ
jgi:hypothetical protein